MKALLIACSLLASTAQAAPPGVQIISRIETPPAIGNPELLREADGTRTLVQLEELPGDAYNYRLVAYPQGGAAPLKMKVGKPRKGDVLYLTGVERNGSGELVATVFSGSGDSMVGRLYSDNLTSGRAALLAEGSYPAVLDRLQKDGQNLALVRVDLGKGPNNTNPVLLRLVDEDQGKVLNQRLLDHSVSAKLGLDRRGQLVAILMGYELFALFDVESGELRNLIPPRRQPSSYPGVLDLSIGSFITLRDEESLRLLDTKALLEGELRAVRTFAPGAYFLGEGRPTISVEPVAGRLLVRDLASGRELGRAIPLDDGRHGSRHIDAVENTPFGFVAVVAQQAVPNSFLPGTILTYVRLATGEVLRKRKVDRIRLRGQLLVKDGEVLALELADGAGTEPYADLVNVTRGRLLATEENLISPRAVATSDGRILALTGEGEKVCAKDLLSAESTCLDDPLLRIEAVRYGYLPRDLTGSKFLLPLSERESDFDYVRRGYLEFSLGE